MAYETYQLVEFGMNTYKSALPYRLKNKLKELIIDQIGIQIGCAKFPWSQAVYKHARFFPSHGKSTIVYYGDHLSPEQSAFVNACFSHSQDFDDTCLKVQTHPGAVVIPVAFAIGEEIGASGEEILRAIAAGMEVMLRVAYSVSPDCLKRGHHTPPAAGPFGAAMTAGLLMGLNEEQLLNAMGIAGSFSGGLTEYTQSGGSVKRIHTAIPAMAGIRAAYLAKLGMTGPATVLEGKKGFCNVFADNGDISRLTNKLYEEYLIESVALKAYNCCYFIHAPLKGLLSICNEHHLHSDEITGVTVGTSEYGTVHVGQIPEPTDALGAQFSLHFTLALGLLHEPPNIYTYSNENLMNSQIRSFARKITVYEDEICTKEYPNNWGAVVNVMTRSKQVFSKRIRYPKGNPENPMDKNEIKEKFYRNTFQMIGKDAAETIYSKLTKIDTIPHVSDLTELFIKDKTKLYIDLGNTSRKSS